MPTKPIKPSKEARNKRKAEQRKNPQELRKASLNQQAQQQAQPLMAHQQFGH